MKTHRTPPLDRGIARFTRLLPFLFILFGAGQFIEGEESDDGFHHERNESSLVVSLDAPDGTSMSADYETRTISILVERHEWEIWRNDELGVEEDRNASVMQGSGEPVSISLADTAYGTLTDTSLVADGDGRASTTFQSAGNSGIATVQATVGDSSATIDFDISAGGMSPETYEENWNFSHTEAILSAGLNLPDPGETLSPGTTKTLEAVVVVESWDVYVSDWGNVRTENHSYAPAEGAAVSWSCENGDGTTTGYGTTDSAGLAQGSFTMGSSDAVARIDVSFASGQSTYATIQFNVASVPPVEPEDWTLERSETFPVLSNLSLDGPAEMSANESRIINGQVLGEVWDLWRSTQNAEDWRYNYSTSLSDHTVQFSVSAGNGSMNETAVSTGADGWFFATYTMGDSDGVVSVSADAATASVDISFTHVPGGGNEESVWTVTSTSTTESIDSLSVDGPTYDLQAGQVRAVSGVVQRFTTETVQDQYGAVDTWNSSGPVETGYPVEAIVQSGDGTLGETVLSADATGAFSTTFTMGSEPSRILFRGTGSVESLPIDFTPPVEDDTENWARSHDERVLTVELGFDADPAAHAAGEWVQLRAQTTVRTWEVWTSNRGNTDLRNESTGTAIGAPVSFTVIGGDLQIVDPAYSTDSGGAALCGVTVGTGESVVRVTVSFQGVEAQADLIVSTEAWQYSHSDSDLIFTLEAFPADPEAGLAARIGAKVDLWEWEVWVLPTRGRTEARNESISPAGNAQVILTAGQGGTVLANGTLHTGNDGRAETVYQSTVWDWVSGQAEFAGKFANAGLDLPPAPGPDNNGNQNQQNQNLNQNQSQTQTQTQTQNQNQNPNQNGPGGNEGPTQNPADNLHLEFRELNRNYGGTDPIEEYDVPATGPTYETRLDENGMEILVEIDGGTPGEHIDAVEGNYSASVSWTENGVPESDSAENLKSYAEAINHVQNYGQPSPEFDWNGNSVPLTGGGFRDSIGTAIDDDGFRFAIGNVLEVRLVSKNEDGTGYRSVESPTKRSFLKVTKQRVLAPYPFDWTVTKVETLDLEIPAQSAKSSEDGEPPVSKAILSADLREGYETQVCLLPIDIVAVFGFGGEPGKAVTKAYLEAAATSKSGKVYMIKGKDSSGADKTYTVLLSDCQADLQQGLSTPGCVVVYDGHSNMGMGPSFGPASISRLSDFTNIGNPTAAINLSYWQDHDYPSLTVNSSEIASSPTNYVVSDLDKPTNNQRYPNNEGVASGGSFPLLGPAWYNIWLASEYHFTRTTSTGGTAKFLIANAGAADLPELNYGAFFYNSCNSGRDYIEVFNRGTFFYTIDECSSPHSSKLFIQKVMTGAAWSDVLTAINGVENVNKMITR